MSGFDRLAADFWTGRISRREFLARAAALGVSAGLVSDMLAGRLTKAAAAAAAPKRGGTLKVALDGEIDSIDPQKSTTIVGLQVTQQIYESLVTAAPALDRVVPLLAQRWEQPSPTTYVFHLHKGVRFHNGKEFKAEDVAFSFARIMDPKFGAPWRSELLPVRRIEILNDYAVRFVMSAPFSPFPIKSENIWIMPKLPGHDFVRKPIGTGPFEFVEWVSGQRITLRRNNNYWQESLPYLAGVQFRPIPEPATRVVSLRTGDVDVLNAVPLKDVSTLAKEPSIKVHRTKGTTVDTVGFHLQRQPFRNNVNLRLAVAWAIDRKTIAEDILFGLATPAVVGIPERHWAFNPKVRDAYGYDLDRAKRFLAQANPRPAEISVKVSPTYPDEVKMAELIQASLAQLGIKLKIIQLEWSTWIREVITESNFESEIVLFTGGIDPDDFLYAGFKTGTDLNFLKYSNPQVDDLLERARRSTSQKERQVLYYQIQEKLVADVPGTVIVNRESVMPMTADLRDFVMHARYDMDFRRVWLAR